MSLLDKNYVIHCCLTEYHLVRHDTVQFNKIRSGLRFYIAASTLCSVARRNVHEQMLGEISDCQRKYDTDCDNTAYTTRIR